MGDFENSRNRGRDRRVLAAEVLRLLRRGDVEYGAWGQDDKRPFGFSGTRIIACDILDAIGVPELDPEEKYTPEQEDYAHDLYNELDAEFARAADWLLTTDAQTDQSTQPVTDGQGCGRTDKDPIQSDTQETK